MGFVVTKETIENAHDYVSLAQKAIMINQQAADCIEPSKLHNGISFDGESAVALPPRFIVNEVKRSLLEMSMFLSMYLNVLEPDENGDISMTMDVYEEYASAHIFNQLAVMKSGAFGRDNPELKTKIANMISDFNDYQKRLTAEIRNILSTYNDPCDRIMTMITTNITPEYVKNLLANLDGAEKELLDYKRGRLGQ